MYLVPSGHPRRAAWSIIPTKTPRLIFLVLNSISLVLQGLSNLYKVPRKDAMRLIPLSYNGFPLQEGEGAGTVVAATFPEDNPYDWDILGITTNKVARE